MKDKIVEALKTVEDPELFLDVWFLGLIYNVEIAENGFVEIEMTFTTPMCPFGPDLMQEIHDKVADVDGVNEVRMNLVFDPPWTPNDEVKALLGLI